MIVISFMINYGHYVNSFYHDFLWLRSNFNINIIFVLIVKL